MNEPVYFQLTLAEADRLDDYVQEIISGSGLSINHVLTLKRSGNKLYVRRSSGRRSMPDWPWIRLTPKNGDES